MFLIETLNQPPKLGYLSRDQRLVNHPPDLCPPLHTTQRIFRRVYCDLNPRIFLRGKPGQQVPASGVMSSTHADDVSKSVQLSSTFDAAAIHIYLHRYSVPGDT